MEKFSTIPMYEYIEASFNYRFLVSSDIPDQMMKWDTSTGGHVADTNEFSV